MNKIKTITVIILVGLIVSCSSIVKAENTNKTQTLTLEQCINIAINKNPNIDLAKNTTNVYKSKIGQARSDYLPQVGLTSGYSRLNPITSSGPDKNSNSYSANASVDQLLYDFGKTPLNIKIQKLNLNSTQSDLDESVVDVVFNVKKAFYNALTEKVNKDVYEQSIKQYEQHLKQSQAFFNVGTKSKIDVINAQVNLSNAKLNLIKAEYSYKTAISSLNNAIGLPEVTDYDVDDSLIYKHYNYQLKNITEQNNKTKKAISKANQDSYKQTEYNIVDNLVFKKYNMTFEETIKQAYDIRPDLKSLMIKDESAQKSIKLIRKNYYPSISGSANYAFGGQEFPLDEGWSFGVNAKMSVFNGLLTRYQVDEAKANLDVIQSQIKVLKQNIYMQVQQAYLSLIQAEKTIPLSVVTVKQAKENLDIANGRYNVGVGNYVELQDAETNYNNAQLAYVQVFYNYYVARSTLEKAMGIK